MKNSLRLTMKQLSQLMVLDLSDREITNYVPLSNVMITCKGKEVKLLMRYQQDKQVGYQLVFVDPDDFLEVTSSERLIFKFWEQPKPIDVSTLVKQR